MIRYLWFALLVSLMPSAALAQTPAAGDAPFGMTAISGIASSARHCVSGDAANVHPIGWVEAGSRYTITMEADFTPMTGIARLNLDEERATVSYGTPDIRGTASTSGTMTLYVGGARQGGCYRYKVEIEPPARSTPDGAPVAPTAAAHALPKPPKGHIRTMAISGLASSAKHCVAGSGVSNVHGIGRVEQGNQVRLTFDSDFDPVAGVTLMNLEGQRGTFLVDDDSGGDLEPLLNFTASQSGTLALYVGTYDGQAGCYRYRVEIQPSTASPPPSAPAPPPPAPAPPSTGRPISQQQAEAVVRRVEAQVSQAMANAFSNIRFAAAGSGLPVSRPALINIPISGRSPCSGGGSVNVTGNMSGNDPTGTTFTLLMQMTTTLSDCREGDLVINGDPYMSTAGSFRVTGGNFSADVRDGGGFSFTGGVAGSCQQNITTSMNLTGGRSSGTLTCRGNGWSVVHTINIPF